PPRTIPGPRSSGPRPGVVALRSRTTVMRGGPMPRVDVDALRAEVPALAREQDGRPVVFLDGPGGTQVPQRVIDAVVGYYRDSNANAGGAFTTSQLSDAIVD